MGVRGRCEKGGLNVVCLESQWSEHNKIITSKSGREESICVLEVSME